MKINEKISALALAFIMLVFSGYNLQMWGAEPVKQKTIRKKNATIKKSSQNSRPVAYPYFADLFFLNLPSLKTLDLINVQNIKSVTEIIPVYDTDFEDGDGEETTYEFNRDGTLVAFSNFYRDAAGGKKYTIEYNDAGKPVSIFYTESMPTQDSCSPNEDIEFLYNLNYDGDILKNITEQALKIYGKAVKAPIYNMEITYDFNGKATTANCKEMPEVGFKIDSVGKIQSKTNYIWETNLRNCRPKWVKSGNQNKADLMDMQSAEPTNPEYIKDHKGNWIKKIWKETDEWDSFTYYTGITRKIIYY